MLTTSSLCLAQSILPGRGTKEGKYSRGKSWGKKRTKGARDYRQSPQDFAQSFTS